MKKLIEVLVIAKDQINASNAKALACYETKFIKSEKNYIYDASLVTAQAWNELIPYDASVLTISTNGKGMEGIMQRAFEYEPTWLEKLSAMDCKDKIGLTCRGKIAMEFDFKNLGIDCGSVVAEIAHKSTSSHSKPIKTYIIASLNAPYSSCDTVPHLEKFAIPDCKAVQYYELDEETYEENKLKVDMTVVVATNGETITGVLHKEGYTDINTLKTQAIFHLLNGTCLSSIYCEDNTFLKLGSQNLIFDHILNNDNPFHRFVTLENADPELEYCLVDVWTPIYDYEIMQNKHKKKLGENPAFIIAMRKENKIIAFDGRSLLLSEDEIKSVLRDNFDTANHGDFYFKWSHGMGKMKNGMTGKVMEFMVKGDTDLLNPYIGRYVNIREKDTIQQAGTLFVLASDTTQGIFLPKEEVRKLCGTHFGKNLVWHKQMKESVLESFVYPSTRNLVGLALDQKNVFIVPIKERIEIQPRTDVSLAGGFFRV